MDGSPLPRCNQEEHYYAPGSMRVHCPAEDIVNPENAFYMIVNEEIRRSSEYYEAIQVQPQHVNLKLRISKFINLVTFCDRLFEIR